MPRKCTGLRWRIGLRFWSVVSVRGSGAEPLRQLSTQQLEINRFGHASVAARLHNALLVCHHGVSGNSDDRNMTDGRIASDPSREGEAIFVPELNVEQHNVRGASLERVQSTLKISGADDVEAFGLQPVLQQFLVCEVVFNHQHKCFHASVIINRL